MLNLAKKNYSVTELETLAIVWAITHFHSYLYGGDVTVLTDYSAVKSMLEASNPIGKYARWWTRVYGIKSFTIVHRAGRENASADALSRSLVSSPLSHGNGQDETQVSEVVTDQGQDLSTLLQAAPANECQTDYSLEQLKDPELKELILYLREDVLPDCPEQARKLIAKASQFSLIDSLDVLGPQPWRSQKSGDSPSSERESPVRVSWRRLWWPFCRPQTLQCIV